MKYQYSALLIAMLVPMGTVSAAGLFDGQWKGSVARGGNCAGASVTATIVDGNLAGQENIDRYQYPVSGTLAPDGSFVGKINGLDLTGKFEGTHFYGEYTSPQCQGVRRALQLEKTG